MSVGTVIKYGAMPVVLRPTQGYLLRGTEFGLQVLNELVASATALIDLQLVEHSFETAHLLAWYKCSPISYARSMLCGTDVLYSSGVVGTDAACRYVFLWYGRRVLRQDDLY